MAARGTGDGGMCRRSRGSGGPIPRIQRGGGGGGGGRSSLMTLDMRVLWLLVALVAGISSEVKLREVDAATRPPPPTSESKLVAALLNANVTRYVLKEDVILTRTLPEVATRQSLTLVGECPRARRCAIDGQGRYQGLVFSDTNFVLTNLEIRNMRATEGAAVSSSGGNYKTATNCVFKGNRAEGGGAIEYQDGWFEFDGCMFEANRATVNGGGAVRKTTDYGSAVFKNTVFKNNVAKENGGAVQFVKGNIHLRSCQFLDNKATGGNGGAIAFSRLRSTIASTKFLRNSAAKGLGGAARFFIYDADITLCRGNTFVGNRAVNGSSNLSIAGDDSTESEVFSPPVLNFCASTPPQTLIESPSRMIKRSCNGCSKTSGWVSG
ncbi:hypothetical protein CBR_g7967 [Chara braunii]|uniref:Right handed beta helix domain-containing protein n=1 Tax=Chara braunii TaxID=69332 RepID=A0A388KKU4_CHABU|nr:hypothetical protein CBR_g7967 [Chara braunii]|eukprot:GBG70666.1 hypothetical protein CBR_g7967 [Chara braunii]